jgi:hypothetical protein
MTSPEEVQEIPKVLSRHALGARRLLGDMTVQALYAEMEAQFLTLAINGPDATIRELNRTNLLCIQGMFGTLQQIAQNNLPHFLRDKDEQIVKTGNGSANLN